MDYKEKFISLINDNTLPIEQREKLKEIYNSCVDSEDDRIRKAIIESLHKHGYLPQTTVKIEDAIAWLKKQSEKHTNKIEIPDFKEQNREHLEVLKEMMASMDISKQDDHRAEIAEREYWRKLRGDLVLKLIDCNNFKDSSIIERVNEIVENLLLIDKLSYDKYYIK